MKERELSQALMNNVLQAQKNEITEYHIYKKLANSIKDPQNREILNRIAEDEHKHYHFWKEISGQEVKPAKWQIKRFFYMTRIFGLTFGIKLLEKGESKAKASYRELQEHIPESREIIDDEDKHEDELIGMIREERLDYVGSVVLGMNDALVELTGTLAGLTFALQNTRLIAVVGLITGIAASLSMAASEYLSTKTEDGDASAIKSSIYTGFAYIITVIFLVLPYFLFSRYFLSLGVTLFVAVTIIFLFNYYISVASGQSFRKRFFEMAAISLGVASISFLIGFLVREYFGVDI